MGTRDWKVTGINYPVLHVAYLERSLKSDISFGCAKSAMFWEE